MSKFDPFAPCPSCGHIAHVGIECRAPYFAEGGGTVECRCVLHVTVELAGPDAVAAYPSAPKKKRRSSTSPTVRTLKECQRRGWLAGVVERRNPKLRNVTHDLFGFADVMAVDPHAGRTLLIQATADMNHLAARQRKLEGRREPAEEGTAEAPKDAKARERVRANVITCLRAGVVVEVWGWRKLLQKKKDGKRSKRAAFEVARRRAALTSTDLPGGGTIMWDEVDA